MQTRPRSGSHAQDIIEDIVVLQNDPTVPELPEDHAKSRRSRSRDRGPGRNRTARKRGTGIVNRVSPRTKRAKHRSSSLGITAVGVVPMAMKPSSQSRDPGPGGGNAPNPRAKIRSTSLGTRPPVGHGRSRSYGSSVRALRKQGERFRLASERAGIYSTDKNGTWHNIDSKNVGFRKKATRGSLGGFSVTNRRNGQSGMAIESGHKMGPVEIGRNRGNAGLASIKSGIRPMKYSEQQWSPDVFKRAPGAATNARIPTAALQGHRASNTRNESGLPIQQRKAGPIQMGRFRGSAGLASIKAGIKPMRYSEQNWDPNFAKRRPGAKEGSHNVPVAALQGHSASNINGGSRMPVDSRKAGPTEIGRHRGHAGLASIKAGIKPMRYSEQNWDPDFMRRAPGAREGQHGAPSSALKGFTATKLGKGESGMPVDSRKAGPKEIGRNRGNAGLASIRAGIKPMRYSEQNWDPNFVKRSPGNSSGTHGVSRASLKGFTATSIKQQSGMSVNEGRKQGPKEIGRNRTGTLASEKADWFTKADANSGNPNFDKEKVTRFSLQGHSTMAHGPAPKLKPIKKVGEAVTVLMNTKRAAKRWMKKSGVLDKIRKRKKR